MDRTHKNIIIILLASISFISNAQQPFYGERKFISSDTQDTIIVNGSTISGVDSIEVNGVWYSEFGTGSGNGDIYKSGTTSSGNIPIFDSDSSITNSGIEWNDTTLQINGVNGNTFIGNLAGSSTTTSSQNTFIGNQAGVNSTTGLTGNGNNTFVGAGAGLSQTTGYYNTYIGFNAGRLNLSGTSNVFIGEKSAYSNTGNSNTIIGRTAGYSSTGSNNVFLGLNSGYLNTGSNNIFIGFNSGYNETGSNLLYIDNSNTSTPLIKGFFAQDRLEINNYLRLIPDVEPADSFGTIYTSSVDSNIYYFDGNNWMQLNGLGDTVKVSVLLIDTQTIQEYIDSVASLYGGGSVTGASISGTPIIRDLTMFDSDTSITNSGLNWNDTTLQMNGVGGNTAIGNLAGSSLTTATQNTFLGNQAGRNVTTGYIDNSGNNTFIGAGSGLTLTTGYYNTFVGFNAGRLNLSGVENTAIGEKAGYSNTGSTNTFIGAKSGYSNTGSGNVFIGNYSGYSETGSNKLYIANTNTTTPLIGGDFSTGVVTINNILKITPQASAPSSPAEGWIYSNSTDHHLYFYNGTTWVQLDN